MLRLSALWGIPGARRFAVSQLDIEDHDEGFITATRLRMAWDYSVTQWVEPSFRKLVMQDLTEVEYAELGAFLASKVRTCQDRRMQHRRGLLLGPTLPVGLPLCDDLPCTDNWPELWKATVLQVMISPFSMYEEEDMLKIMDGVRGREDIGTVVCDTCYASIQDRLRFEGPFHLEAVIIKVAARALVEDPTFDSHYDSCSDDEDWVRLLAHNYQENPLMFALVEVCQEALKWSAARSPSIYSIGSLVF